MSIVQTIGRMLLGGSIRRALWRSPKALLIAAALVGLVLISIGTARAQTAPPPYGGQGTQEQAWAACQSYVSYSAGVSPGNGPYRCELRNSGPSDKTFVCRSDRTICYGQNLFSWFTSCPADAPWNPETGTCGTPNTCASEANKPPSKYTNINTSDSTICTGGCKFESLGLLLTSTVDGQTVHNATGGWAPTGAQCSASGAGVSAPAPTDSDGDGTSDGFDGSPNNPGSGGGGGADGLGQPEDGHCGGEGQPACGENGSGSGNGNTSGGGGNCAVPPSSTGDPILAQIAYQTWATRCAIEGKGTGDGNGDSDAQPEWTKGNAPPVPGGDDESDIAGSKRFGIGIGPGLLDDADIFGGGSCPQFSFQIAGTTISSSEYPQWCNVVAIMRALILIFGAFTALRILMGSE